jgi:hypothetical protein
MTIHGGIHYQINAIMERPNPVGPKIDSTITELETLRADLRGETFPIFLHQHIRDLIEIIDRKIMQLQSIQNPDRPPFE